MNLTPLTIMKGHVQFRVDDDEGNSLGVISLGTWGYTETGKNGTKKIEELEVTYFQQAAQKYDLVFKTTKETSS